MDNANRHSRLHWMLVSLSLLVLASVAGWWVWGRSVSTASRAGRPGVMHPQDRSEAMPVEHETPFFLPDPDEDADAAVTALLPVPAEQEDVEFTPYEPGSLVYAVDSYVRDEQASVDRLKGETFHQTLRGLADFRDSYSMLIMDVNPEPASPESLKLIVYSRRFAKLLEHAGNGLDPADAMEVVALLRDDLARWEGLWAQGQRIRALSVWTHIPTKPMGGGETLIVPLTYRINATVLLAGALELQEALPSVVQMSKTLGDDVNWSAAGYASDKILMSLDLEELSLERRAVVEQYQAWKSGQEQGIFAYERVELPSFASARRPFERATWLGASVDISAGSVVVEIPHQFGYRPFASGEGYSDSRGRSPILKEVVAYAEAYCQAKP